MHLALSQELYGSTRRVPGVEGICLYQSYRPLFSLLRKSVEIIMHHELSLLVWYRHRGLEVKHEIARDLLIELTVH